MFDETTNINGRYILNILMGECSAKHRENPIFMKTFELENTNSMNINMEIISLLTNYTSA